MTEAELEAKNKALQKELDDFKSKLSDLITTVDELKTAKVDLVKQRDDLKKEVAAKKDATDTKDATVEQLKELLIESKKENEELSSGRKADKVLAKLEIAAKKAGFVTDKDGNVNMKLLKSQIDINGLHIDDDGDLLGAEHKLEKLKSSDPFFFPKKNAPGKEPKIDPKNVKGEDLSPEALQKKDFRDQVIHMNKLGKITAEQEKENGLPPGMTMASSVDRAAGEGSEPANPAE